jgi:hypothetical protein
MTCQGPHLVNFHTSPVPETDVLGQFPHAVFTGVRVSLSAVEI